MRSISKVTPDEHPSNVDCARAYKHVIPISVLHIYTLNSNMQKSEIV